MRMNLWVDDNFFPPPVPEFLKATSFQTHPFLQSSKLFSFLHCKILLKICSFWFGFLKDYDFFFIMVLRLLCVLLRMVLWLIKCKLCKLFQFVFSQLVWFCAQKCKLWRKFSVWNLEETLISVRFVDFFGNLVFMLAFGCLFLR